jgi:hypothetical protein
MDPLPGDEPDLQATARAQMWSYGRLLPDRCDHCAGPHDTFGDGTDAAGSHLRSAIAGTVGNEPSFEQPASRCLHRHRRMDSAGPQSLSPAAPDQREESLDD